MTPPSGAGTCRQNCSQTGPRRRRRDSKPLMPVRAVLLSHVRERRARRPPPAARRSVGRNTANCVRPVACPIVAVFAGRAIAPRRAIMGFICGGDSLWDVNWASWDGNEYAVLVYMAKQEPRHRFVKATMRRHRWDVATFCRAQVGCVGCGRRADGACMVDRASSPRLACPPSPPPCALPQWAQGHRRRVERSQRR